MDKISMRVLKRVRITSGPKRHRAFPGLVGLNDGTLFLTYREGSDHWNTDDSVVKATRSTDGGATWSEPSIILEETGWGFAAHHGGRQLSDGSMIVPAVSVRHVGRGSHLRIRGLLADDGVWSEFRVHALRSVDNGRSWDARRIGPMPGWLWQNQYGRVMEVDGKLWLPGGGQRQGEDFWRSGYFVSHDNGQTWPEWNTVCTGLQDEKDMLGLADRRMLAMIRSGQQTSSSFSSDRGESWSAPQKLTIFGQCPSLLLLPSGLVVFAYREVEPRKPKGIGVAVSNDGGRSWNVLDPLYVAPDASSDWSDCGYPSMVLAGPKEALCAYYTTCRGGDCHIELAAFSLLFGDLTLS